MHKLPPAAVALLRWGRFKVRVAAATGLLLGAGIALVVPLCTPDKSGLGWLFGGIVGGSGLFIAFVIWLDARPTRRALNQFVRGEYIAHWTYSADEWRAFDPDWEPDLPVGEAYIGKYAGYCGETFTQWNVLGCFIADIRLDEGPPAVLQITVYHPDPANGNDWTGVFRAPVPAGKEAEARHVVRTLGQIRKERRWLLWVVVAIGLVLGLASLALCLLQLLTWWR